MQAEELEYVGFWARVGASLIDSILVTLILWPILTAFYGQEYWSINQQMNHQVEQGPLDVLLTWVLPAAAIIVFWLTKQATPGKMLISAKVVDARTGDKLTPSQSIGRYLAYYVAFLPFALGFIWIAFDKRKQGWHDKLAGTVVVREKSKVSFDG
jgi:uncharacterized RDD family membrane protein YckC